MINEVYDKNIINLQNKYYEQYYKKTLFLRDADIRIKNRLEEEELEFKRVRLIFLHYLNTNNLEDKNILVIGLGTGSVLYGLNKIGFKNIYAVEPNIEALKISHLKAEKLGLNKKNITCDYSESLPFKENSFDYIFTFTVFEHVTDVNKSFDEAIRTLRVNGTMYLEVPNYNYPYEDHYKISAPTFLGKKITKLFAYLLRGDSAFINTLQFLTPYKIDKILKNYKNIVYLRVCNPYPKNILNKSYKGILYQNFYKLFYKTFNMSKNQEIIIKKINI